MNNAFTALEKLQRLQSVNPDGQYCITMNAAGYYRVADLNEKTNKQVDVDILLKNLTIQPDTDFLVDY